MIPHFFMQKVLVRSRLSVLAASSINLWLFGKAMKSFVLLLFLFLFTANVEAHPGHGQFEAFQKDMNEKRMEIEKISSNCTSASDVCSQVKANYTQFIKYLGKATVAWRKYEISASYADGKAFEQLHEKLDVLYENISKTAIPDKE